MGNSALKNDKTLHLPSDTNSDSQPNDGKIPLEKKFSLSSLDLNVLERIVAWLDSENVECMILTGDRKLFNKLTRTRIHLFSQLNIVDDEIRIPTFLSHFTCLSGLTLFINPVCFYSSSLSTFNRSSSKKKTYKCEHSDQQPFANRSVRTYKFKMDDFINLDKHALRYVKIIYMQNVPKMDDGKRLIQDPSLIHHNVQISFPDYILEKLDYFVVGRRTPSITYDRFIEMKKFDCLSEENPPQVILFNMETTNKRNENDDVNEVDVKRFKSKVIQKHLKGKISTSPEIKSVKLIGACSIKKRNIVSSSGELYSTKYHWQKNIIYDVRVLMTSDTHSMFHICNDMMALYNALFYGVCMNVCRASVYLTEQSHTITNNNYSDYLSSLSRSNSVARKMTANDGKEYQIDYTCSRTLFSKSSSYVSRILEYCPIEDLQLFVYCHATVDQWVYDCIPHHYEDDDKSKLIVRGCENLRKLEFYILLHDNDDLNDDYMYYLPCIDKSFLSILPPNISTLAFDIKSRYHFYVNCRRPICTIVADGWTIEAQQAWMDSFPKQLRTVKGMDQILTSNIYNLLLLNISNGLVRPPALLEMNFDHQVLSSLSNSIVRSDLTVSIPSFNVIISSITISINDMEKKFLFIPPNIRRIYLSYYPEKMTDFDDILVKIMVLNMSLKLSFAMCAAGESPISFPQIILTVDKNIGLVSEVFGLNDAFSFSSEHDLSRIMKFRIINTNIKNFLLHVAQAVDEVSKSTSINDNVRFEYMKQNNNNNNIILNDDDIVNNNGKYHIPVSNIMVDLTSCSDIFYNYRKTLLLHTRLSSSAIRWNERKHVLDHVYLRNMFTRRRKSKQLEMTTCYSETIDIEKVFMYV